MNPQKLTHLTNLLRHSTKIEFTIPNIFFKNTTGLETQTHEIIQAIEILSKDLDLKLSPVHQIEKEIVTITVEVIQPTKEKQ